MEAAGQAAALPIEAGQVVVLGPDPRDEGAWRRTYAVEVVGRAVWVDARPTEDGPRLDVARGAHVACHTWRAMDALYTLDARALGVRGDGPEGRPLLGLEVLDVTRVQQREFVRVPLAADAWATVTPADGTRRRVGLRVHDLSAGGLRGRSSAPLAPGDALDISLPLPNSQGPVAVRGTVVPLRHSLDLRARVVRLVDAPTGPDECEVGIRFEDVPAEARERIIRFALNVQLEQRRRGRR
jgi:hypothetical protein